MVGTSLSDGCGVSLAARYIRLRLDVLDGQEEGEHLSGDSVDDDADSSDELKHD